LFSNSIQPGAHDDAEITPLGAFGERARVDETLASRKSATKKTQYMFTRRFNEFNTENNFFWILFASALLFPIVITNEHFISHRRKVVTANVRTYWLSYAIPFQSS
jgi:hypothetical protein